METKEKPKPSPDYLMQLMNDKKLMSSLPNFCGIFNHLERLLDEGKEGFNSSNRGTVYTSSSVSLLNHIVRVFCFVLGIKVSTSC